MIARTRIKRSPSFCFFLLPLLLSNAVSHRLQSPSSHHSIGRPPIGLMITSLFRHQKGLLFSSLEKWTRRNQAKGGGAVPQAPPITTPPLASSLQQTIIPSSRLSSSAVAAIMRRNASILAPKKIKKEEDRCHQCSSNRCHQCSSNGCVQHPSGQSIVHEGEKETWIAKIAIHFTALKLGELLERRGAKGRIRRGHDDDEVGEEEAGRWRLKTYDDFVEGTKDLMIQHQQRQEEQQQRGASSDSITATASSASLAASTSSSSIAAGPSSSSSISTTNNLILSQKIVNVLDSITPSPWKALLRSMPFLGSSRLACEMVAHVAPIFSTWLVGESYRVEHEVEQPGRPTELWKSSVKIERCRYLEGVRCKSACMYLCKIPTQTYFANSWGIPLTLQPSFDDLSCIMTFGQQAPTTIEEDATYPEVMAVNSTCQYLRS